MGKKLNVGETAGEIGKAENLLTKTSKNANYDAIEDMSKRTYKLELDTKNILNELNNLDQKILQEEARIEKEKLHFEKFQFLHHDKPMIKSAPLLNSEQDWYENNLTDSGRF